MSQKIRYILIVCDAQFGSSGCFVQDHKTWPITQDSEMPTLPDTL